MINDIFVVLRFSTTRESRVQRMSSAPSYTNGWLLCLRHTLKRYLNGMAVKMIKLLSGNGIFYDSRPMHDVHVLNTSLGVIGHCQRYCHTLFLLIICSQFLIPLTNYILWLYKHKPCNGITFSTMQNSTLPIYIFLNIVC